MYEGVLVAALNSNVILVSLGEAGILKDSHTDLNFALPAPAAAGDEPPTSPHDALAGHHHRTITLTQPSRAMQESAAAE